MSARYRAPDERDMVRMHNIVWWRLQKCQERNRSHPSDYWMQLAGMRFRLVASTGILIFHARENRKCAKCTNQMTHPNVLVIFYNQIHVLDAVFGIVRQRTTHIGPILCIYHRASQALVIFSDGKCYKLKICAPFKCIFHCYGNH